MPQINTLEEAVEIAELFLHRYYPSRRLENVKRDDGQWVMEFDVGILSKEIVLIKLDAATGAVIAYEKPKHEKSPF
mgnify:CR=1 FL=1